MSIHSRLLDRIHYDPATGIATWKNGPRAGRRVGTIVPGSRSRPYRRMRVRWLGVAGTRQFSHVAHLYMTGRWPEDEMDHGPGGTLDDSWPNIRPCTREQNEANRGARKNNKTGFKGVWLDKRAGKYRVGYHRRGKHVKFGSYDQPEQAHAAYVNAVKKFDGKFLRAA